MSRVIKKAIAGLSEGFFPFSSALFPFVEYEADDRSAYEGALLDILDEVKIMSKEAEASRMSA